MATFSLLPTELAEHVFSHLAQPDLYAVCQTNKGLHALVIPFLYRNVDLYIRAGDKLPRIDKFCWNIITDPGLAARVETIRLGPSSGKEVNQAQRWLPRDRHFDDTAMFELALQVLDTESLILKRDYLGEALLMREYSAYAALILIVLPSLQGLHIADFDSTNLDHLQATLRNLDPGSTWNRRYPSESLIRRLENISTVTFNVDRSNGMTYPRGKNRLNLEPILKLPAVHELEISIPDGFGLATPGATIPRHLPNHEMMKNITSLVTRHSSPLPRSFNRLLVAAVQLRSLTCDFFYDSEGREDAPSRWLDLMALSESLPRSLEILVLSIEICDQGEFPFQQPRVGEKLFGYLDLTRHTNLHTLEVPVAFLTGDVDFSITTEIYPLLPPNLRHLSLRTDMAHAQHRFRFDTSRLDRALTFQESQDEALQELNARMDVSYLFHAAMILLDFAPNLDTISVWQPADPSLSWFDGQIEDFAQACRNKSIKALVVYPMILRWKKQEHWNLVKEVTVYNPSRPQSSHHEVLYRGQRGDIPLGLASQYHLHALQSHQLRMH